MFAMGAKAETGPAKLLDVKLVFRETPNIILDNASLKIYTGDTNRMTLIVRHCSNEYGSRTIGDLLTSLSSSTENPIHLPFRPRPEKVRAGDYVLSGFAQKTVIFGNSRILWAGSFLHSRTAIKKIYSATNGGQDFLSEKDARLICQKADVDLDSISLIYSHIVDYGVQEWSINCNSVGTNIDAVGSGEWDFFSNTELTNRGSPKDESEVFENLIVNAAAKTVREIFTPDYDFLYGGWFEQTGIKDWQFLKLPTAIKIWPVVAGEIQRFGPLFFSHYFDHNLAICTIGQVETEQGVVFQPRCQLTPDLLKRDAPPADPFDIKFAPASITHVFVRDSEDGRHQQANIRLENFDEDMGFDVSFYRGERGQPRFGLDISDAYVSRLKQNIDWTAPTVFPDIHTGGHTPEDLE